MRGFHSEDLCMKNTLDQLKDICVLNNISLPQGANMSDDEENNKKYDICLHASLSLLKAYLTDSRSSNHMVASRESFITFPLSGGPSSHMGDESKIPVVEKGSNKIHHAEFNNGLYVPSPTTKQIVEDEEEARFSSPSIRMEESLLGVTPSLGAPKVYEISDISYSHKANPEEDV